MRVNNTLDDMLDEVKYSGICYSNEYSCGPVGELAIKKGLVKDGSKECNENALKVLRMSAKFLNNTLNEMGERAQSSTHYLTYSDLQFLVTELICNAIGHGNKFNPDLYFTVKLYVGEKGWVGSVKDSGKGFDVNKVIEKKEYQCEGKGLKQLEEMEKLEWNYQDAGSQVIFMCKHI